MKRNWIILGLVLLITLTAGQATAMTIRADVTPKINDTSVAVSVPFYVDIYMNNNDSMPTTDGYRLGVTIPFSFTSPDASITNVLHTDIGGSPEASVLYQNGFEDGGFFDFIMLNFDSLWSWDGVLPDSMCLSRAAMMQGWPFNLGELVYIRFGFQIDNRGTFCIDSAPRPTFDWLFENPSPVFNPNPVPGREGSYCWFVDTTVGVKEITGDRTIPEDYALDQNYPNPFNPTTTMDFALPQKSSVTLNIYNVLGQKIRTLVNSDYNPGYYSVTWDGTSDNGIEVASGVYFYRIKAGNFVDTKKLMMLK
jgi:hypothetical protein